MDNLNARQATDIDHNLRAAEIQHNLGLSFYSLRSGDREANLRYAIACYKKALQVYTREEYPREWASTQNDLGYAYMELPGKDNRPANVEQAIVCFEFALRVYASKDIEWAKVQQNLGYAYSERIIGDRQQNLERAIHCYESALRACTKKDAEWAKMQNNLGNIYAQHILGKRQGNLEQAINCYRAALHVYTRKEYPLEWAGVQNSLGNVYAQRIVGDQKTNLERAIEYCNAALQIYTRKDFPIQWAETQNDLGNAYVKRIAGDRQENLEQAISCYKAALTVYDRGGFPAEWAETQNNLGSVYSQHATEGKRENVERAISYYRAALTIFTQEDFPEEWARIQLNLGDIYVKRMVGDRRANMEQAIACYEAALQVYTRDSFPDDWFTIQESVRFIRRDLQHAEKQNDIDLSTASKSQQNVTTEEPLTTRITKGIKDFFISYANDDCLWAEWIARQLEGAGFSTILQALGMKPRSNFVLEMSLAAEQAERIIAIVSPAYLSRLDINFKMVVDYITEFSRGTLIPVLVRELNIPPEQLRSLKPIDLIDMSESTARRKLLAGVNSELNRPRGTPSFSRGDQQSLTKPAPFPGKIQQDKILSVAQSFEPIKLPKKSIDVFLSYTHQDEELHNQLAQQLKPLQRQGLIGALYDQEIRPGRHWSRDIDIHLNVANLILLLISPDYVASGYIYERDLRRAINRHESGEARVIPIILRPTDWSGTPLGKLPILPRNAEPITMWHNLEEALLDVARSVRRVVEELAAAP